MIRKVLASALLVIMPFSGMRVICVDSPAGANEANADQATASSDCDQICAVHRSNDSGDSHCALGADASSLFMSVGAAVLPSQEAVQAPTVVVLDGHEIPQIYLEPGLARLIPPPKA